MSATVLCDASGAAVSIGTVVVTPLPAGLSAVVITNADFVALLAGTSVWDATTRTVKVDTAKAAAASNQATVDQLLTQAMDDLAAILAAADPAAGTLTAQQLSNAVRQLSTGLKTVARVQRRALRELRSDYSGTD